MKENTADSTEYNFLRIIADVNEYAFEGYRDYAQWLLDNRRHQDALAFTEKAIAIFQNRPMVPRN